MTIPRASRVFIIFMILVILISDMAYASSAEKGDKTNEEEKIITTKMETRIGEVKKRFDRKKYKRQVRDTITVSPAYGRKIKLAVYNRYQHSWEVRRVYNTKDKKTVRLTITYPAVWKAFGTSKWSIIAPKTIVKKGNRRIIMSRKSVKTRLNLRLVKAKSAVVLDCTTGKCYFVKKPRKYRKVASMTKMMTMILLSERKKTIKPRTHKWRSDHST